MSLVSLDSDRLGRDSCARGFVRAAQYLANLLAGADVLAESEAILRGAFAPDVVCFGHDLPDLAGCSVPDADGELVRRAVDQVLRTGFMAIESSGGEQPSMAYVVLPVSARGRTETALVIGYQGERSLPSHVLDTLLAVAGLVGATLVRQRTEGELQRLNADLERRVAERTAELAASSAELDAFARSVAHDLRSPLRAVAGFSQAVLQDYGGELDERGKRYLQMAVDGSQRMARLIDGLLSLSRVTRAQMARGPVDLGAIAREIEADLRRAEPDRAVELEIGPGLLAEGDPGLLRIVLEQLMQNAWKFTSKRSIAHVRVGQERSGGQTAYFVSDDGVGFDTSFVEGQLVRPFRRLHSAHEFPGNGLGLATAYRVVRRHGGEIWAHGEVGRGATVYFTLASPGDTDGEQDHPPRRGRTSGRDVDRTRIQGEQGRE